MTCNVRSAALKLGHAVRQTEGNDGAIRPVATVTLYDPTVEQTLALGDAVRLAITGPCARCVMTTLPQADLPKDALSCAQRLNTTELTLACTHQYCRVARFAVVSSSDWMARRQR